MPAAIFGILQTLVALFFGFLVICLVVQLLLSWLPIPPTHPLPRFFRNITGPLLDPLTRLIPPISVGPLDLRATVAFIFVWWGLSQMSTLLIQALP